MPSRSVCWGIFAVWLATTTWFVYRDVLPMFQTSVGPQLVIDLTDEVGARFIRWDAYQNGQPVGRGQSYVKNAEDRSFELGSEFYFDKLKVGNIPIFEMSSKYNVDKKGRLLRLESITRTAIPGLSKIKITGSVVKGQLKPEITIDGKKQPFFQTPTVDVSKHGTILNTMHLFRKLRGLKEGKSWTIPLLDPLSNGLSAQGVGIPILEAVVRLDSMEWEKVQYPCYKIEYRKPKSDKILAKTWVRKSDGAVLKQEANFHGMELVYLRTRFVGRRMPLKMRQEKMEMKWLNKKKQD